MNEPCLYLATFRLVYPSDGIYYQYIIIKILPVLVKIFKGNPRWREAGRIFIVLPNPYTKYSVLGLYYTFTILVN